MNGGSRSDCSPTDARVSGRHEQAPKQFIRGEWFVTIAALTALVWILCAPAGLGAWAATGISFVVGSTVRVIPLYQAWEEPLAKEPEGVNQHSDGRPMLAASSPASPSASTGSRARGQPGAGAAQSQPGWVS